MKINSLIAENFMKLNVDVEMNGHDVTITGKNGVGKSSFINAIFGALTGKDIPDEPIQQGKDTATLQVTVDRTPDQPLIVIRKFSRNGKDVLTVKTPDGAKYTSPQAFLNTLLGEISFDPFEFIRKQPADQKKQLQKLLGIDTTKLEADKKIALGEKKAMEDLYKQQETQLEALPEYNTPYLKERKMDEVAEKQKAIRDKTKERSDYQETIDRLTNAKNTNITDISKKKITIESNLAKITELMAQIAKLENDNEDLLQGGNRIQLEIDQAEKDILETMKLRDAVIIPPDTEVTEIIAEINKNNDDFKKQEERHQLENKMIANRSNIEKKKEDIEKLETDRMQLISSAKMPIPGLDFSDEGLTFDGLPFTKGQLSTARMNMIGFSIAVAMNPKLRIMRVNDWVLLDGETQDQLKALAKEHDFQMFVEQVTDDKEIGFKIEE